MKRETEKTCPRVVVRDEDSVVGNWFFPEINITVFDRTEFCGVDI